MSHSLPLRPTLRVRDDAFSYRCRACSRCCHHKRIQLNPYELARLAEHLGTTTTEVITRHTRGGTMLAARPDGACTFLGPDGCAVHPARPLVCRLYPLGVIVTHDGREGVVELEPHPESEGECGTDGTVDDYFTAQGAGPYFVAAARYHAVLQRLEAAPPARGNADDELPDVGAFTDPHQAVAWDVARGGQPAPTGAEALVDRHLGLLARWATALATTWLAMVSPLRGQDQSIALSLNGRGNQATASWTAVKGSSGYQLMRREVALDAAGKATLVTDWGRVYAGTATSYPETFTKPSVLYEYLVEAGIRTGAVSSPVVRYAVPAYTTPTSLSISGTGDRATVTWGAATAIGGYELWRQVIRHDGTAGDHGLRATVGPTTTTWGEVVPLDGLLYQYQVVALDAVGGRWATPWVGYRAPLAVAPVVWVAGAGDRAILSWPINPGASGYAVTRAELDERGRITGPPVAITPTPVTAATASDVVPSPGAVYEYVVTAIFPGGTRLASEPVAYRSPAFMTPGNVLAAGAGGRIGITWCGVSSVAGYHVFRRKVELDGRTSAPVQRNSTLVTMAGFTDLITAADGMVEYQVVAVGRDGRQWPSEWVRATQ